MKIKKPLTKMVVALQVVSMLQLGLSSEIRADQDVLNSQKSAEDTLNFSGVSPEQSQESAQVAKDAVSRQEELYKLMTSMPAPSVIYPMTNSSDRAVLVAPSQPVAPTSNYMPMDASVAEPVAPTSNYAPVVDEVTPVDENITPITDYRTSTDIVVEDTQWDESYRDQMDQTYKTDDPLQSVIPDSPEDYFVNNLYNMSPEQLQNLKTFCGVAGMDNAKVLFEGDAQATRWDITDFITGHGVLTFGDPFTRVGLAQLYRSSHFREGQPLKTLFAEAFGDASDFLMPGKGVGAYQWYALIDRENPNGLLTIYQVGRDNKGDRRIVHRIVFTEESMKSGYALATYFSPNTAVDRQDDEAKSFRVNLKITDMWEKFNKVRFEYEPKKSSNDGSSAASTMILGGDATDQADTGAGENAEEGILEQPYGLPDPTPNPNLSSEQEGINGPYGLPYRDEILNVSTVEEGILEQAYGLPNPNVTENTSVETVDVAVETVEPINPYATISRQRYEALEGYDFPDPFRKSFFTRYPGGRWYVLNGQRFNISMDENGNAVIDYLGVTFKQDDMASKSPLRSELTKLGVMDRLNALRNIHPENCGFFEGVDANGNKWVFIVDEAGRPLCNIYYPSSGEPVISWINTANNSYSFTG